MTTLRFKSDESKWCSPLSPAGQGAQVPWATKQEHRSQASLGWQPEVGKMCSTSAHPTQHLVALSWDLFLCTQHQTAYPTPFPKATLLLYSSGPVVFIERAIHTWVIMASLWDNPFAFLKDCFWRPNVFTQRPNTIEKMSLFPDAPALCWARADINQQVLLIPFYRWGDWSLERFNNTFNVTDRKWQCKPPSPGLCLIHSFYHCVKGFFSSTCRYVGVGWEGPGGCRVVRAEGEKDKQTLLIVFSSFLQGFPRWLSDKESTANAGDMGSIPGSGRSPGEGNGNPFQYSCLENPMDRGAWQATVHGVTRVGHDLVTKQHKHHSFTQRETQRWLQKELCGKESRNNCY